MKNINLIPRINQFTLTKLLIMLCFVFITQNSSAGQKELPFSPGEKLEYSLSWANINAGRATFEVLPIEKFEGQEVYHFVMKLESSDFVDMFFKVRDTITSYSTTDMTKSLLFLRKHEGKNKKEVMVTFDTDGNTAQLTSTKSNRDPIEIEPGTIDPLSSFFFARYMLSQDKEKIENHVTDGKKLVIGKVNIIKREQITIQGKEYDAILIEPSAEEVSDIAEKKKNHKLQIWVSADNRRIPLKVQVKIAVGSFSAELVSASGLVEKKEVVVKKTVDRTSPVETTL